MRERLDETIDIPAFSQALVNTDDAVAKRIRVEHENLTKAIAKAQDRFSEMVHSYNATFAYRVSQILIDPEVPLPPLPHWGDEKVS